LSQSPAADREIVLLAALKARGLEYRSVAEVELLDFEAPTLFGNDARLTDHGVILPAKM
jgi:hypothetical protein